MQRLYKRVEGKYGPLGGIYPDCGQVQKDYFMEKRQDTGFLIDIKE